MFALYICGLYMAIPSAYTIPYMEGSDNTIYWIINGAVRYGEFSYSISMKSDDLVMIKYGDVYRLIWILVICITLIFVVLGIIVYTSCYGLSTAEYAAPSN